MRKNAPSAVPRAICFATPSLRMMGTTISHLLQTFSVSASAKIVHDRINIVRKRPLGIMRFKFGKVGNIPDMIAHSWFVLVRHCRFLPQQFLGYTNSFEHRDVALPSTAGVIYLSRSRLLMKVPEHVDQIVRVDVITHLLAFVTENRIVRTRRNALYQIGEEAVQLCPRVVGPREASTTKHSCIHREIFAVLLHQHVSRDLRCPKNAMERLVDGHRFINSLRKNVVVCNLKTRFFLNERQIIRPVSVYFVG